MSKKELLNLKGARKPLQIKNMKRIIKDGVCPFCPEHLQKYHTPKILREDEHWLVTPSMYPYDHTKRHMLLITKAHVSTLEEISSDSWVSLQKHLRWINTTFKIKGGTLLMRFGDMSKTGGTVKHLHVQFIVAKNAKDVILTRVG